MHLSSSDEPTEEGTVMANVFEILDAEWRKLREDRASARKLAEVCRTADEARTLGDVEEYVRQAGPEDADRVLLALVARALDDNVLAARVLLQLLLPGTRKLARRWWALGDHDERASAAVAAVYGRIRNYPLARRPGRVAANVLMDAGQDLRRAVPRVITLPSVDPTVLSAVDAPADAGWRHPADELAEVLAEAVADGLITPTDAELIARSRIGGDRMADIAHERGLAARTVWDRRQRAEAVLATAS